MISKLLKQLKDTKIDLTNAYFIINSGIGYTESKFDITPKDFLRFAKQDLKQENERGLINSLTNSKRAIDCQIDEALEKLGIKYKEVNQELNAFIKYFDSEKDIPIKLKIIHNLNLAPTLLISKTRTIRNNLEHIYKRPSIEEVKNAIDTADLFIRSVTGNFKIFTEEFGISDLKNYIEHNSIDFKTGLSFKFNSSKLCFDVTSIVNSKKVDKIVLTPQDKEYCFLLRLIFSVDDKVEIEATFIALLKHIGHPIPAENVCIYQSD